MGDWDMYCASGKAISTVTVHNCFVDMMMNLIKGPIGYVLSDVLQEEDNGTCRSGKSERKNVF